MRLVTGADLKVFHRKFRRKHIFNALLFCCVFAVVAGCRKKQTQQPLAASALRNEPLVRVLLLADVNDCTFACDSSLKVTTLDGTLPDVQLDPFEEPVRIRLSSGRISFAGWGCSTAGLHVVPEANSIFSLNGRRYRGRLDIVIAADGNSFDAVNVLGTEAYLAGVIGAEMPGYWEPQALEAQTIAARTYCLYIKERFGARRHWDMRRTAASQKYNGVSEESPAVWQAVARTSGKVLVCAQDDGSEDIFPAYYCSTCAGHTENSKNVFGDEFAPLVGVPCDYCRKTAKREYLNWPSVYVPKSELNAKLMQRYPQLARLGYIEQISPASSSSYDGLTRLTSIKLEGVDGASDTLRAEDFRLAVDPTGFKIKSAAFEIQNAGASWAFVNGKGYGHGVGLCQYGAQAMAREGKTTDQILGYYYPGAKIIKRY
jgi:stage II sporulation protein D